MFRSMKSEAIRITRPSFLYGGLGLVAGFTALITFFVFDSASSTSDVARPGPGPDLVSITALESAGGFAASLGTVATLVGIITLAFWALAAASDYETGLIRTMVQAQPSRVRLLAGKIGALVGFTLVSTALATVVATLVSWPLASVYDVSTAAWGDGVAVELVSAFANLTGAALVWGIVGLAIAVVTRSAGLAIAAGIGDLMVVENLLGLVAGDVVTYLPASALDAVATGGNDELGYAVAVALGAGYGLVAAATAAVTFLRREIVS